MPRQQHGPGRLQQLPTAAAIAPALLSATCVPFSHPCCTLATHSTCTTSAPANAIRSYPASGTCCCACAATTSSLCRICRFCTTPSVSRAAAHRQHLELLRQHLAVDTSMLQHEAYTYGMQLPSYLPQHTVTTQAGSPSNRIKPRANRTAADSKIHVCLCPCLLYTSCSTSFCNSALQLKPAAITHVCLTSASPASG
jgi:hypothetical protein